MKKAAMLAMVSHADGFGAYIPDDDPEPGRAKDCKELKKAEECRAQGCEYTKATGKCAHWPIKNSLGKITPPPDETLTPDDPIPPASSPRIPIPRILLLLNLAYNACAMVHLICASP